MLEPLGILSGWLESCGHLNGWYWSTRCCACMTAPLFSFCWGLRLRLLDISSRYQSTVYTTYRSDSKRIQRDMTAEIGSNSTLTDHNHRFLPKCDPSPCPFRLIEHSEKALYHPPPPSPRKQEKGGGKVVGHVSRPLCLRPGL